MAILVEDVACRVEAASPSELGRVQSRLAGGVVGALTRAGDVAALEAGGGHVVKVREPFFFLGIFCYPSVRELYSEWGAHDSFFFPLQKSTCCSTVVQGMGP